MRKLVIFMPSIEGGGVEKNLFIISNYLAKNIKNTHLITADKNYNKKFKNIRIINSLLNVKQGSSRKYKYVLCLYELIKLIIKDKKITVFAFQANFYCVIICKIFFNVNLITRSNSSPSGWSQNFLKKEIFKFLFKLIDCVIVNSQDFKKEIKKRFNVSSVCIYNPLNLYEIKKLSKKKTSFSFFKNSPELKIINVGRYAEQKDQITLLKALNIVNKKIKFKAVIMGRGILKEKLISFIKKNKLTKKIKLVAFQHNPFKYIKLSDLFVLSSKFEGLPNVLLESIVLEKFIISANCPTGPREILSNGKGGELYKVGDFNALAKKILYFNNNKTKLLKKIKYAQSQLYRFNKIENLNNYYNIIQKYLLYK